jgi:xylulokinase
VSLLALDIGTSRIKAILARPDGAIVAVRSAATPVDAVPGERHAFPPAAVLATTEALVTWIGTEHPTVAIDTLVLSCLGTALAPIDSAGVPLGAALSPADPRPLATPGLRERIALDDATLFAITGSHVGLSSFLLQWLWWETTEPATWARVHRLRSLRGVIVAAWTGADAEDPSWASRTMVMDLATDDWSPAILAAAGLDRALLPTIEPATSAFPVDAAVGRRLGLSPGARVVLGAMDNTCAFLGASDPAEARLANIAGTYEHMAGVGPGPVARAAAMAVDGLVHRFPLAGRDLSYSRVPIGLMLGEIASAAGVGQDGLERLWERVVEHPTGAAIPLQVESVRAILAQGNDPAWVLQAVLESGAAVLARYTQTWLATGGTVNRIVVVGGGAVRTRALQLKANVLGRPVSTLETDEAAGLGALRLAAIATDGLTEAEACARFPNPVVATWAPAPSGRR